MAIQIRRGTDSGWESNNSNIVAGEPAVTTDTERFFVGVDSGEYMELVNIDTIAPAYDSSVTYNVGDYCVYQGNLYVCNTANTTGTWSSSNWAEITIKQALDDLATRSVPTSVREAIYTLLNNCAYATTGLTDEIAIVESWAEAVTSLTLSASTLSLSGDTPQTLIPTVVPSYASVSWSSSDNSIATVVGGVVTGVSNGSCVITATAGNKSANCAVTVSGFATLESISAVYTQSGNVLDTDTLDSLKDNLVVTATYSDTSTAVVTSYTLSGTLTTGTSTITVAYSGKTTTFNVTVKHDTTAQIEIDGKFYLHKTTNPKYTTYDSTNAGCTIKYAMDAQSTILYPAGIIPTGAWSEKVLYKDSSHVASLFIYNSSQTAIDFANEVDYQTQTFARWAQDKNGTMTEFSISWDVSSTPYNYIAFSVDTRYLDDAYMYDKQTGQVWFAGRNTPYCGMSNISEAN